MPVLATCLLLANILAAHWICFYEIVAADMIQRQTQLQGAGPVAAGLIPHGVGPVPRGQGSRGSSGGVTLEVTAV